MKYLLSVFLAVLTITMYGQAPLAFNYQGVARNGDGEAIAEQEISLFITLLAGGEDGFIEYEEEHIVTTSPSGLFAIRIGEGLQLSGNIDNIDWGIDTYYIQTEIDPAGGEDYIKMGASQLLSVPYALYAAQSGASSTGGGGDQTLLFTGTTLSIENGNSVDLSALQDGFNDADADPHNELQNLSLSGDQLSIDAGNTITLPTGTGGSDDQTLTLNGNNLSISNGNTVDLTAISQDGDNNASNELQNLTLSGNQLSISGGNTISLPSEGGGGDQFWESLIHGGIHYSGREVQIGEDIDSRNILMGSDVNNAAYVILNNEENEPRVDMIISSTDYGNINTYGPNGNTNVGISVLNSNLNHGAVAVRNEEGVTRGLFYVGSDDAGATFVRGENGELNAFVTHLNDAPNSGFIGAYNHLGNNASAIYAESTGQGVVYTNGANGNTNVRLGYLLDHNNNGYLSVHNSEGQNRAGIFINSSGQGVVFAEDVTLLRDNPEKSGEQIAYSVLQGPESAMYIRGTAKLSNGEASIVFPKHFANDILLEGMTVILTPLSADSKGLAVIEKKQGSFNVKELFQGKGGYEFDWEVKAHRKSAENKAASDYRPLNVDDLKSIVPSLPTEHESEN